RERACDGHRDRGLARELARLMPKGRRRLPKHPAPATAPPGPVPRSEIPWRPLSSRPAHANRWMTGREDLVELPHGRSRTYRGVSWGQCVGLLPLVDRDTVLLVRQFRYVAGRPTWEMPTGGVHPGESLEQAAQRELAEETGHRARRLRHLSTYH